MPEVLAHFSTYFKKLLTTKPMTTEELRTIANMETYGGSFVQALAVAFMRSDSQNFEKLKKAFPEYWEQYRSINK